MYSMNTKGSVAVRIIKLESTINYGVVKYYWIINGITTNKEKKKNYPLKKYEDRFRYVSIIA